MAAAKAKAANEATAEAAAPTTAQAHAMPSSEEAAPLRHGATRDAALAAAAASRHDERALADGADGEVAGRVHHAGRARHAGRAEGTPPPTASSTVSSYRTVNEWSGTVRKVPPPEQGFFKSMQGYSPPCAVKKVIAEKEELLRQQAQLQEEKRKEAEMSRLLRRAGFSTLWG